MNEHEDTSMDELAASLGVRYPSPARTRMTTKISTPLSTRSPNVRKKQLNFDVNPSLLRNKSPSKSVLLSAGSEDGTNPWQIKVTVQAQPTDGSSMKSPSPRSRTMRVPLNDGSSPAKARGAKRKSEAEAAIQNRKGTPMKRRAVRTSTNGLSMESMQQDDIPPPESQMTKRTRGRPRRSTTVDGTVVNGRNTVSREDVESHFWDNDFSHQDQEEQEDIDLFATNTIDASQGPSQLGITSSRSDDDRRDYVQDREDRQSMPLVDEMIDISSGSVSEPLSGHTDVLEAFDSTNLTPRHAKNSRIRQLSQQAPMSRQDLSQWTKNGLGPRANTNRFAFSPLPQRRPFTGRPVSPFRNRVSSPTSLADADMWRDMIAHKASAATVQSETSADSADSNADLDDFEELSDAEAPEMTTRTAGDATMIQGEDFSIVSLSSLPSRKDLQSSLIDQSGIDQSAVSIRQKSRLGEAIEFSSPQPPARAIERVEHLSSVLGQDEEVRRTDDLPLIPEAARNLPKVIEASSSSQRRATRLSSTETRSSPSVVEHKENYDSPRTRQVARASLVVSEVTEPSSGRPARLLRLPDASIQHQTPKPGAGRLPTPNSSEILTSTSKHHIEPQLSQSSAHLERNKSSIERGIEARSSMSEIDIQSSPRTPKRVGTSSANLRESPAISSSLSRRSWVDEPAPPHIKALEINLQQKRDDLHRTLARAEEEIIEIRSDQSSDANSDDESLPAQEPMAGDIWQDISVEEDRSELRRRDAAKSRPNFTGKRGQLEYSESELPAKIIRLNASDEFSHYDRTADQVHIEPSQMPNRINAGVQRKTKNESDVSAIFRRLDNGNQHDDRRNDLTDITNDPNGVEPFESDVERRRPYTTQRSHIPTFDVNETDLSDIRQLRFEAQQAQRRPPFPVTEQISTRKVPTNLKSIDDTTTELEDDSVLERSSFLSINNSNRSTGSSLFAAPQASERKPEAQSQRAQIPTRGMIPIKPAAKVPKVSKSKESLFSYIFSAITYPFAERNGRIHVPAPATPYTPPARPTHELLTDEGRYPLLPGTWPWSVTHYRILDNLYQVYKRKPSRFTPRRSASPNNTSLMTPSWSRYIDIQFDHWGYRIRLEDTHIVLAILFSKLLLLPGEREWRALHNGEGLEWGEDWHKNCRTFRKGQRIDEMDVLKKVFGIIAGEFIREDEEAARLVRRDLDEFRYKLSGDDEWSVFWD